MSKAGDRATRFVAFQSDGTGANHEHWGHFWATGVLELGGDIGVVAETPIYTEAGHAAACKRALAAGYEL